MKDNTSFGEFVTMHRKKSGYPTMVSLADAMGVHKGTLSNIEKNKRKPKAQMIDTLAKYLTTTTREELMFASGYWDQDEEYKKTSMQNAQKFKIDLQTMSDDELLELYGLARNGKELTETQARVFLKSVRDAIDLVDYLE